MAETAHSKPSAKKIFTLMKEYFLNSDDKLAAWLLLIGTIICVVALVALMTTLAWWSAGFWAILAAKTLAPFLISIGELALIVGALAGVGVLKNYLIGKLSIRWRNWLTTKIINDLFDSANNYLDLKRFPSVVENISQRVQEDVKTFVELTLTLSADLLKSVLSVCSFSGTLWVVGGALTFALFGLNIVIPGFLVWTALIVAIVATVSAHFIGKTLPKASKEVANSEANLRRDLIQLDNQAENIAVEHAEHFHKASIQNNLQSVKDAAEKKLNVQTKLTAFQYFYYNLAQFLPTIFAAPLYFSGLIEIGQLMQIGMSFTEVSMSLSMIVNSYEEISTCRASIERIIELQVACDEGGLPNANPKSINRKERNKESISIKNLDIQKPQAKESSSEYMMRGLNLKLVPREHVLMKGRSGFGKSTLFKVISGTWQYGAGKVSVPSSENTKICFLSQRYHTLSYGTLREALAYPEPAANYTDEQCVAALDEVGSMEDFTANLDEKRDWTSLSGGEQQRMAVASVRLKDPDWVFLDEATAALDEESENRAYNVLLKTKATLVSIGHRSTLEQYHSRVVLFTMKDKENKVIELEDTKENEYSIMS